jgi:DNA-directed RNA polymerase specialized sigma24 family protein
MRITPHVLHAIDDLTNEIFLRLRQELGDVAVDDPQGSLCATLLEIEKECAAINVKEPRAKSSSTLKKSEQAIERALQSLTPDQRDALFLHLGKGMTCLEIAQQTGVPREAVLNDLVRAYSRVRLLLGDDKLHSLYK